MIKFKLPQVHIAVNVAGLTAALGSAAGFVLTNPGCVSGIVSPKDALAATAVAGALAAFLPTKAKPQTPTPKA